MITGAKRKTRLNRIAIATIVTFLATAALSRGADYSLHFTDPVGDATPYIDLTGMDFSFDPVTGAFHARLFATSAEPFNGAVWVGLALLNTDRLAAGLDSELFTAGTIVGAYAPTMVLDYSGISPLLTTWRLGDRVAPGQFPAPPIQGPLPPEGGAGNTSVRTFDVNGISFHYLDDMGIDQSSLIQPVPEPATLVLATIGIFLLVCLHRRRNGQPRIGPHHRP